MAEITAIVEKPMYFFCILFLSLVLLPLRIKIMVQALLVCSISILRYMVKLSYTFSVSSYIVLYSVNQLYQRHRANVIIYIFWDAKF